MKKPASVEEFIKKSEEAPEEFWHTVAENAFEDIHWFKKWD